MYESLSNRTILARRVAAACGTGVLLLGAAACGSSSSNDSQNAASNGGGNGNGAGSTGSTQQQRPGANGKVAAVSGSTAQVQSTDAGQVAVSWTSSTTFTKQVAAKLADVKVGDCVMVAAVADDSSSGADQSTPPTQPTAITAESVRVTEKVDGSCTVARGGRAGGPGTTQQGGQGGGVELQAPDGGGQQPEGGYRSQVGGGGPEGGTPPSGAPGGRQFRAFGGAFGTVKSVSASGFVVSSTVPSSDGSTQSTDVTVTVAKATTYTTTAKAAAADVKVGVCVNANGTTDSTGAVKATRVAVTPAVDGQCTGGFARIDRAGGGSAGATTS